MSVATTYAKLCEVVAGSSGITSCPTEIPTQINDGDVPCAIVRPATATWNEHATGLKRQVRTYVVSVYVKAVAQGAGVEEGYQACMAPLNALGRTILDNPDLDETIDHIGERGEFDDGGIVILNYARVAYHGFEFRLRITEKST